jgi:hypothetical protein
MIPTAKHASDLEPADLTEIVARNVDKWSFVESGLL